MRLPYLSEVEGKSKEDCAKALYGDKTYDTALPQDWLNDIADTLPEVGYHLLLSSYVWLYERTHGFLSGRPAPLSIEARVWLKQYDAQKGTYWHLTQKELEDMINARTG